MKIKIFVSCHKETSVPPALCFIPVQVGASNTDIRLQGMKLDNEGDNISLKNPMYCELTAQYWAWKNEDADYYGLCHYRRYLNFSEIFYETEPWGNIIEDSINESSIQKYGLTDDAVEKAVDGQDIVIYNALDVTEFPEPSLSVWDHYNNAPHLNIEDINIMMNIIEKKYPEYYETAQNYLKGKKGYFCSLYVMKKDIFQRYNSFLFDILKEFEKKADMRLYDIEGLRTPGHLAERLLGIFVLQEKKNNPSLKVKELQNVLFTHPEKKAPVMYPAFDCPNTVPIIFSSSNEFAPVCAVVIESIIENAKSENYYDIVILETEITDNNKQIIKKMVESYPNFSIRFANVRPIIEKYNLLTNEHISSETYYRFLIQDILPKYDKALYFDSDIICRRDVAELFSTKINNNLLGAVVDADMNGQIKSPDFDSLEYLKNELNLKDPYSYFQAGVLLMNLKEMRKECSVSDWLQRTQKMYRYLDQDILNKYCQGRVHYLDMAWNTLIDCNNYRVRVLINGARWEVYQAYYKARKNPFIIHYAGFQKPWNMRGVDFENEFWRYARNTPYYEHFIYNLIDIKQNHSGYQEKFQPPLSRRIKYKIVDNIAASKFLPVGSLRRKIAQKVYHILNG